uniref:Uncharacterized protein n=1 Tax=Arundo donax TaxID=35708 RepID=A0A0A8ZR99_ARUDO
MRGGLRQGPLVIVS